CIDLSKIVSREAVISVRRRGDDSKTERLSSSIVKFCLGSMKGESHEIMTGQEQATGNQRGESMLSGRFYGQRRIRHGHSRVEDALVLKIQNRKGKLQSLNFAAHIERTL